KKRDDTQPAANTYSATRKCCPQHNENTGKLSRRDASGDEPPDKRRLVHGGESLPAFLTAGFASVAFFALPMQNANFFLLLCVVDITAQRPEVGTQNLPRFMFPRYSAEPLAPSKTSGVPTPAFATSGVDDDPSALNPLPNHE
ncbi:MAG: hypothetical protein BJ554DRAFT_7058, partial [Olpidium bornovanus]